MRALVTGCCGFVGLHLARHLSEAGDAVTGLVRPSVPGPDGVETIEADVRDTAAIERIVRAQRPEAIYHLAALSHVGDSWDKRRETLEVNFFGAFSVLEAARAAAPPPRVLLVGSAEQYGVTANRATPLDEGAPLRPVTPYGASKVAQEGLGLQYAHGEGVPVVLVRSFNHTGPGQPDRFVIPSWARQIAEIEAGRREPVLEVGNLDVTRDFTDVRDIARLYRALVEKGRIGEIYNACSGVGRSLHEVIETLRKLARRPFEVRARGRDRPVDQPRLVGSCDKAQREVGWRRTIPFERTLADVLDYWRRQIAG